MKNTVGTSPEKFSNETIFCKCLSVDDLEVSLDAIVSISDHLSCKVSLIRLDMETFRKIKDKEEVTLCLKDDSSYMIVFTEHISQTSHHIHDLDSINNSTFEITYYSSILLHGYYTQPKEINFSSFSINVTDQTELIGCFPYDISTNNQLSEIDFHAKGKMVFTESSNGYSYIVSPTLKHEKASLSLCVNSQIQYTSEIPLNIKQIQDKAFALVNFLELLCDEFVSINQLLLHSEDELIEYVGIQNFFKYKLHRLDEGFDSVSYLRKSLFKITDFRDPLGTVMKNFITLKEDKRVVFQTYLQTLLSDDNKIFTPSCFLNIMQIVEGYQCNKSIEKKLKKEFKNVKKEIVDKLQENSDKSFIEEYTNDNGLLFHECLYSFTNSAIFIISNCEFEKENYPYDQLLKNIKNDRNAYTHASNFLTPFFSEQELHSIYVCYKVFFRIMVLHKLGIPVRVIRQRLKFDRIFCDCYNNVFCLKIDSEDSDWSTSEFDQKMANFK